MNIVFFGSSKYSTIVEEAVHKKYPISLVVTIPNRKSGSQILQSPVKKFAENYEIPTLTTDILSDKEIEIIAKYKPDFLIVCDYGLLIPKKLLDLPKKAAINVHHSLLPKYRGPTPAPSAILDGERSTGVTIMEMGVELDTGDILAQTEYEIKPTETTDSLLTILNELGAKLLLDVVRNFEEYYKNRKKQDNSKASSTPHMTKQDGYIDITNPKSEIPNHKLNRMIRAYFPWPGVYTKYRISSHELRIKLLPGQKIQVEGKKPMSIKDFINGYKEGKEIVKKLGF